jgi:hypothetical protein
MHKHGRKKCVSHVCSKVVVQQGCMMSCLWRAAAQQGWHYAIRARQLAPSMLWHQLFKLCAYE